MNTIREPASSDSESGVGRSHTGPTSDPDQLTSGHANEHESAKLGDPEYTDRSLLGDDLSHKSQFASTGGHAADTTEVCSAQSPMTDVLTPRMDTPPADQRDYDDRHNTRATSSDVMMGRYVKLGWHKLLQQMVRLIFPAACYVGGVLVLHNVVELSVEHAVTIVSGAYLSAAAGSGLRQAFERHGRRQSQREDPAA